MLVSTLTVWCLWDFACLYSLVVNSQFPSQSASACDLVYCLCAASLDHDPCSARVRSVHSWLSQCFINKDAPQAGEEQREKQ